LVDVYRLDASSGITQGFEMLLHIGLGQSALGQHPRANANVELEIFGCVHLSRFSKHYATRVGWGG